MFLTSNDEEQKCKEVFFDGVKRPDGAEGSAWAWERCNITENMHRHSFTAFAALCAASYWMWKHHPLFVTICLPPRQTPAVQGSGLYQGVPVDLRVLRRRGFESVSEPFYCLSLRLPARFTAAVYFPPRWENRLKLTEKKRKNAQISSDLLSQQDV